MVTMDANAIHSHIRHPSLSWIQSGDELNAIHTDASDTAPWTTGVPQFHRVWLPPPQSVVPTTFPVEDIIQADFTPGVKANHLNPFPR
jgi:hypothetical protein